MVKMKSKINGITIPNTAYTRQQVCDSNINTNTMTRNESSQTTMSSAATLSCKDERSLDKKSAATSSATYKSSGWLYKRQKYSQRNRILLGCIGLVVFMVLLSTVVLWVGSAFILPQNKYSTTLSQVPLSSSYAFKHHLTTSASHPNPTATTRTTKPKATNVKPQSPIYHADDDDDNDNDNDDE